LTNTGTSVKSTLNGQTLYSPRYDGTGPTAAVFSPDGAYLVIGFLDGAVRVYDAESGEQLDSLTGHTATIQSVAFSSDGTLLITTAQDSTMRIWQKVSSSVQSQIPSDSKSLQLEVQSHTGSNRNFTIRYSIATPGDAHLRLYDVVGREIRRFLDYDLRMGSHQIEFHAETLPPGCYFIVMEHSSGERVVKACMIP
jgi:WD40 repeat protein